MKIDCNCPTCEAYRAGARLVFETIVSNRFDTNAKEELRKLISECDAEMTKALVGDDETS